MKKLLILSLLLVIVTTQAQSKWELIRETYIPGSIRGTIKAGHLFKIDREYYIITGITMQLVMAVNPNVKIYHDGYEYMLKIESFDEPVICSKIRDVIETQIYGEFSGWEGNTIFKMLNGQIWQQVTYNYMYHYSYSPNVIIYKYRGSYNMIVEGVEDKIEVKQLK